MVYYAPVGDRVVPNGNKNQKTKGNKTMANHHDRKKHQIAIKFSHRVWRQIEIAAEQRKMTPGQFIRWLVTEGVDSIELNSEDAEIIAERIRRAELQGRMV